MTPCLLAAGRRRRSE